MQTFTAPGECIYCGSTRNLRREHIVPFALNGEWVIPKASCERCAAITGKFEGAVLRGPLLRARAGLGLRTRNSKERPAAFPLLVTRSGNEVSEQVPTTENLSSTILPIFAPAGFLTNSDSDGIAVEGFYVGHNHRTPEQVKGLLGAESIAIEAMYPCVEFARMIAKIAYSYAVALHGIDSIRSPLPLPAILGESNDIGRWVGTANDASLTFDGKHLHVIQIHRQGRMMQAAISLFSLQPSPIYHVLLQG